MAERPDAGDARHRGDVRLAGPGRQRDHLPGRAPGHPGGAARRGERRRRRPLGPLPGVVLPLLTPSIFFTGVLALIDSFQVFDQIFVLERPRATDATITVVYFIYENGFKFFKMGYASAASWILFLIVAVFTAIYFRLQGRWVHYQ